MKPKIVTIKSGGITDPAGFYSGAVKAGIKKNDAYDLGILYSDQDCIAAGVFTKNIIKSAPVLLSQQTLLKGSCQAIVVNSGCANACTGEEGLSDAIKIIRNTAEKIGVRPGKIAIAGTGVIGVRIPMDKFSEGIAKIELSKNNGIHFAQSIMTTDTFIKQKAIKVKDNTGEYTISGVAKGAGMIHPNMATMLSFITTDANVEINYLKKALKRAVDCSFNMVTVDGDTSPSDTVIILANGLARNETIKTSSGNGFQKALNELCVYLAKCIAKDGEGATKLIEIRIEGAATSHDAQLAARTVANSPLVKTAIHGNDPNWGRIIVALGRSGATIIENKVDLYLNDICVMKQGKPAVFNKDNLSKNMANNSTTTIYAHLNIKDGTATAWGCDLSKEYVTINSAYTT